jgi:hypothetical protein
MSFNSVNQYTGTHKTWDHIGNVLPNMEYSEGIRAHFDSMPAAWLPVTFYEKHYENWLVWTAGKILGVDPQGRVVPAQYMQSSATVTYTTNDVNSQTIDVRTGNACTSASVSASPITLSGVTAWMGVTSLTWAAKAPIGAASYNALQWAGDGAAGDDGTNPSHFRYHNYIMQHRVAATMDYALQLPVVPAPTASESLDVTSNTGAVTIFSAVSNLPVAKNTTLRTPITFANSGKTDAATRFVNEVATSAEVLSAGDWHIDLTSGVITVYSTETLSNGDYTVSYYNYASAASTVSVFACVLGNPLPGDFLKCDTNSNWVVATPHTTGDGLGDAFDDFSQIMGQVLGINEYPRALLDRVRTAYSNLNTDSTGALPGSSGQMDQMPGSANGGVPASVHYTGAANLTAVVNMVSR